VTLRPDNFLTVGLIILIAYTAAVLLVQLGMRAGILSGSAVGSTAAANGAVQA
jgi:hypothetical protein